MDIHVGRTIGASAETVAPFFFDVSNNVLWQSGMRSCTWTSAPPIAAGSTYEQVAEFRKKPVVSTFEVVAYEPGRTMQIESIESTFPIQVTRTVTPIDESSCRVEAHISGRPPVSFRLLVWLVERDARKSIEADYDRLVEHFRSGST